MPKSRRLIRATPPLTLPVLLAIGEHASARLQERTVFSAGENGAFGEVAIETLCFCLEIARALVATSDAPLPAKLRDLIYYIWELLRRGREFMSASADTVDLVVRATCRGAMLSRKQWRFLEEYPRRTDLDLKAPPPAVTAEMLQRAVTWPLADVREVGLILAPHVQA